MANELKDRIHTSVATGSGDWASFRSEVTGKFLNDNKQVDIRIDSWTGAAGQTTGLLIEPFDAGFRYTGTGNFSNYP